MRNTFEGLAQPGSQSVTHVKAAPTGVSPERLAFGVGVRAKRTASVLLSRD